MEFAVRTRLALRFASRLAAWLLMFSCALGMGQDSPAPQPVADAPNLLRLEGTDPGSGIHYVRLMLSLPLEPGGATAPPRFTVECTQKAGSHDISFFVSFGGVSDTAFTPPFRPTREERFPPANPTVQLTMTFEGYMKWKPLTRAWELLPSGELRYRNPATESPNLEAPRSYLPYMRSLPGLRIRYAHSSAGSPQAVFFQLRPLLDEIAKTPACR